MAIPAAWLPRSERLVTIMMMIIIMTLRHRRVTVQRFHGAAAGELEVAQCRWRPDIAPL